jgi:hypothetical protein
MTDCQWCRLGWPHDESDGGQHCPHRGADGETDRPCCAEFLADRQALRAALRRGVPRSPRELTDPVGFYMFGA